jgi:hypothetical protein
MRFCVECDGIDGKVPVERMVEGGTAGPLKDCEAGSDNPCREVGPSGLFIDCEGVELIVGDPPAGVCPLLNDGNGLDCDDERIDEGREGIENDCETGPAMPGNDAGPVFLIHDGFSPGSDSARLVGRETLLEGPSCGG